MMGRSHAVWAGAGFIGASIPLQATGLMVPLDTPQLVIGATLVAAGAGMWPDIDSPPSMLPNSIPLIGPFIARRVEIYSGGHRNGTHTLLFAALTFALIAFLAPISHFLGTAVGALAGLTGNAQVLDPLTQGLDWFSGLLASDWFAYGFMAAWMIAVALLVMNLPIVSPIIKRRYFGLRILPLAIGVGLTYWLLRGEGLDTAAGVHGWMAWAFLGGTLMHLLCDSLTSGGVRWFLTPLNNCPRLAIPLVGDTDSRREGALTAVMGVVMLVGLIWAVSRVIV